jgi:hypothetical protein
MRTAVPLCHDARPPVATKGRSIQYTQPLFCAFFSFNAPCQFTPLLNLRYVIFGLTPFGWLCSVSRLLISKGNIIFDLRPLFFFRNANRA